MDDILARFNGPFDLWLSDDTQDEEPRLEIFSSPRYEAPLLTPPGPTQSLWAPYSGSLATAPSVRMELCQCLIEFGPIIGRGAFGLVVKAQSRWGGQAFAMKVMKKKRVVAQQQIDNIDREARLLMNMQSPFVCKAFDAFQDIENIYIAMEFLPGGDLSALIKVFQRLSEIETRFYAVELIVAISYIHSLGITHHDIKPANILLTRDGHIKLSDFGLARINDISPLRCGTTPFMAPEQFKCNAPVTQSADWYALGVVMYNMLAGDVPYTGGTDMWSGAMQQGPIATDIQWPAHIFLNATLVNLITALLWTDPDTRLGSRGGWDVMSHSWFADIQWESVDRLDMTPPFIPRVFDEHDTGMFAGAHAVKFHAPEALYDQYYRFFPAFRRAECSASFLVPY